MSAPDNHPAWCDLKRCLTDEGVVVHRQAPVRLEGGDHLVPLRFETALIDPSDDAATYLELQVRWFPRDRFCGFLSLDTAEALRDQITAHLDAAQP